MGPRVASLEFGPRVSLHHRPVTTGKAQACWRFAANEINDNLLIPWTGARLYSGVYTEREHVFPGFSSMLAYTCRH
jgi:hypothetical protein